MFVHLCSSLFIDGRFLFQLHGLEGCGNRQPDLARFGNFCNFSRLKLVNLLSRLGDRFLRIAWYDMVCTCMILYDTNLLSCTSPAPLLTPAAPLFPAPHQQKLEGFPEDTSNHFKTNAKLCKAFLCFYIELSDVITCWACMAPLLTSPAPLLTSPAPLLHLSWPLLRLSSLHLSSRS